MADLHHPGPEWEPPAPNQSSWEDIMDCPLRDPVSEKAGGDVQAADEGFLGLDDVIGLGEGLDPGPWWSAPPVDHLLSEGDLSYIDQTFIADENMSLPGLACEVSSLVGCDLSEPQGSSESLGNSEVKGVCSSGSCGGVELDRAPSSNSGNEDGNVSSRSHSPVLTSCSDEGAASPDAGCASSDVGATGRSCDNFGNKVSGEIDECAKLQSRLIRNRESATQSRLRKKAYVKELEAKCRTMESQMSMLHQTVAFTSAQNAALREELAHYRCLKGNGLKSGAMEPAALPSDSLPSESPSRRTTPFLSVKLELVAFLCHVLLLTLLQVPLPKPARSGGRTRRSERREPRAITSRIERFSEVAKQLRKRRCSSKRARRRFVLLREDISLRFPKSVLFSGIRRHVHTLERACMKRKSSGKRSLKRLSKRSQYRYLSLS